MFISKNVLNLCLLFLDVFFAMLFTDFKKKFMVLVVDLHFCGDSFAYYGFSVSSLEFLSLLF